MNPQLDQHLTAALDADARQRLARMCQEIREDPARFRVHYPAAARLVGRGALDPADPQGLLGPTLDDAVRGTLLLTLSEVLAADASLLATEVRDAYRFGDTNEKRAVLRSLPKLDASIGTRLDVSDLLADALRTNDVRLVAAALGPSGRQRLDADAWRQGVLKCLFVGVPLAAVDGLDDRADGKLAAMIAAYAYERVAAGREVPADVWRVLECYPRAVEKSGLLAELDSPYPDRREAAERALAALREDRSADHTTNVREA